MSRHNRERRRLAKLRKAKYHLALLEKKADRTPAEHYRLNTLRRVVDLLRVAN
jgi:hypothetical protein